jgi:hypothetical protein
MHELQTFLAKIRLECNIFQKETLDLIISKLKLLCKSFIQFGPGQPYFGP